MPGPLETFRSYLESLPDELLESVTEDYVWLSELKFSAGRTTDFESRRECCREECLHRGMPEIYYRAELVVSPFAATAAIPVTRKSLRSFR